MPSPSIIYRRLINGEPQRGHSTADFLADIDAVAQTILTRLQLFQGEWWENAQEGLPLFQKILGAGGTAKSGQVALLIQEVIMGSPFVTGLSNMVSVYDPNSRTFRFNCNVQTAFGTVQVSFNGGN